MLDDISPEGSQQVISSLKYPPPGPHLINRVLRVELNMPNDNVVLDETLNIRVQITKEALSVQSHAIIEVSNLTATMRQDLMSHFTAYDKRIRTAGQIPAYYINVFIKAGHLATVKPFFGRQSYSASEINKPVLVTTPQSDIDTWAYIFKGQVVECTISAPPPNLTIRLECFTNQFNKATDIVNQSPDGLTFKQYVIWAGAQMGFDENHVYCKTKLDDQVINNFSRSNVIAEELIFYIEHMDWPNIAAYVDDDLFIVKNRNEVIGNSGDKLVITEFVGVPMWDEWGVVFTSLFTPLIALGHEVTLQSTVNPGVNGDYVIGRLEYELHTRDTPFYVKVLALPPP